MTLWIDARFDGFIVFLRPTRRCVEITLYVPKESRISPNIPILKDGILLRSTILRIFREGSGFLGITPLTQASRPLVEVQICPYRPLGKGLNPKAFLKTYQTLTFGVLIVLQHLSGPGILLHYCSAFTKILAITKPNKRPLTDFRSW